MNYSIRPIRVAEYGILEDMLYEAIYQEDLQEKVSRGVLKEPKIAVFIESFGKPNDACFVAVIKDKIVGAVWTRILDGDVKGYGHIDSETPEFAISLFPEYRNHGIGTEMMKTMIDHLRKQNYKRTSLSVDKHNYAFKMYQAFGFEIVEERKHDYLMVLHL